MRLLERALALGFLVSGAALPAAGQGPLWQRFALQAGGYEPHGGSTVRADTNGSLAGTEILLEHDLGLAADETVAQGSFEWFPAARHEISLAGYRTNRSGDTAPSPAFRFGSYLFPPGRVGW